MPNDKLTSTLRPELDSQKTAFRLALERGLKGSGEKGPVTGLVFTALKGHTGINKKRD